MLSSLLPMVPAVGTVPDSKSGELGNSYWPDLNFAVAYFELCTLVHRQAEDRHVRPTAGDLQILADDFMEYRGVEYSIVQLLERSGWRWEVNFGDGKTSSGNTPVSRTSAAKLAEAEIDRFLKNRQQ